MQKALFLQVGKALKFYGLFIPSPVATETGLEFLN